MSEEDKQNVEVEIQSGETHKPSIKGSLIGFFLLVLAILMLPFVSHWAAEDKGVATDPPAAQTETLKDPRPQ